MRRMIRYSNLGAVIGEVHPNDVMALVRKEEINGEHSLEITTTQVLAKNERIIFQDGRGYWREYVVTGIDEAHADGRRVIGTYYCTWSLQADMLGVTVSKMPGIQSPVSASAALDAIISEQGRWTHGTVTQTTTGGASMYDMSAWKALGVLIDNWGGEVGATITVDILSGVTGRAIDLYAQMGQTTATRRFDFGADLRSVRRTIPDDPLYCRISPRGKGEETEGGGYGRKIRITEVNDGKDYLEYAPMVDVAKLPAGSGWQYPTLIVENSDMETPADLKAWAQGILEETLTPKVTYEVDVVQAGVEGVDFTGVSLGDVVHVVDRYFTDEGLRLEGRVTSVTVDELNEHNVKVKIGHLGGSFADNFARLQSAAQAAYDTAMAISSELSSADYISSLLDRINAEVNATGGYTYITQGQGLRTYDVAVSDPLVGAEASRVVEVKGGTIRIANSKTSGGAWEWKTLLQSGFIAADLINAVNVTAGRIASSDGSSYWDLDNSLLSLSGNIQLTTDGYKTGAKHVAFMGSFTAYENGQSQSVRGLQIKSEGENRVQNALTLVGRSYGSESSGGVYSGIGEVLSDGTLFLEGGAASSSIYSFMRFYSPTGFAIIQSRNGSNTNSLSVYSNEIYCNGNFRVPSNHTKSKIAATKNYSDRLFYCYETPSPMFADMGNGKTDESGICVVTIDDIFAETVRTDYAYQVFLQPCGEGTLHVSDKQPGYFVVSGTPNLAFDWNITARQNGFEHLRMDDYEIENYMDNQRGEEFDTAIYSDELNYPTTLERLQYETA